MEKEEDVGHSQSSPCRIHDDRVGESAARAALAQAYEVERKAKLLNP